VLRKRPHIHFVMCESMASSHDHDLNVLSDDEARFWRTTFGATQQVSWNIFAMAVRKKMPHMSRRRMEELEQQMARGGTVSVTMFMWAVRTCGLKRWLDPQTTRNADVFMVGSNTNCFEPAQEESCLKMEFAIGCSVAQVVCGGSHYAALMDDGRVMAWGENHYGQLGVCTREVGTSCATPVQVELPEGTVAKQIAAGFSHMGVVTDDGCAYTWGNTKYGRLGFRMQQKAFVSQPHKIEIPGVFVFGLAMGSVHSCFQSSDGRLYVSGQAGFAGVADDGVDVMTPTLVSALKGHCVRQVSIAGVGGYHTLVLTHDGRVFSWGHDRVGQLGLPKGERVLSSHVDTAAIGSCYPTPSEVVIPDDVTVKSVTAGWGHSAVLTEGGHLLVCGINTYGQLGVGPPETCEKNERGDPVMKGFAVVDSVPAPAEQITCGYGNTMCLTAEGSVYSSGAAVSNGQIVGKAANYFQQVNHTQQGEQGEQGGDSIATAVVAGHTSALIMVSAKPQWNPGSHHLFPGAYRRVVRTLFMGYLRGGSECILTKLSEELLFHVLKHLDYTAIKETVRPRSVQLTPQEKDYADVCARGIVSMLKRMFSSSKSKVTREEQSVCLKDKIGHQAGSAAGHGAQCGCEACMREMWSASV